LKTTRLRILLVEDDEDLVGILLGLLQGLGHEVVTAKSSLAVLQLVSDPPYNFDLMIVDQKTPVEPGADLAEGLIRISPNVPVILYVDHVDRALLKKAREVGFSVVRKLDDPSNLLICARRLLEP
jgi:CheY-like chemotaxis protein